jgi:hypothetical protein
MSSSNLQRMCLHHAHLKDHELVALLQGLPSLIELVIEEPPWIYQNPVVSSVMVTAELLEQMTYNVSRSSLLGSILLVPKLKWLDIIFRLGFDKEVILDMIRSRWVKVAAVGSSMELQVEFLASVYLDIPPEIRLETIAQMDVWRQEGLKLEVKANGQRVV